MKDSLIIVIIPSKKTRKLLPETLQIFGLAPEKTVAAIKHDRALFLPVDWRPDLLLICDRELTESMNQQIATLISQRNYLYIAHHGKPEPAKYHFLQGIAPYKKNVVFQGFHRELSAPLFKALLNLLESIKNKNPLQVYIRHVDALKKSFGVNWQLEKKLCRAHKKLLFPENADIDKYTLILWNPGKFAENLLARFGKENVAVSNPELDEKIKGKKRLLILAELKWNYRKYSQFHGYGLVQELIAQGKELDILFMSNLRRNELKEYGPAARLLVPVFPHLQLTPEIAITRFDFPDFSPTKWRFIRHYFLKPDGIVDKLLHDIRNLNRESGKSRVLSVMRDIQNYALILPYEIIDSARQLEIRAGENVRLSRENFRKLQFDLEDFYGQIVSTEQLEVALSQYKIMIVEDDRACLSALEKGFSGFFKRVKGFTSGARALSELEKNNRAYSALIVDMVLLDDEDNWQAVQGYDLIEQARNYPHLVIIMLTVLSKRAIRSIQDSTNLGEVQFVSKDPVLGLPVDTSYSVFSDKLLKQIQKRQKYLTGPGNGLWKNGLLQFYYQVMESSAGKELWPNVEVTIEQFLQEGGSNTSGIITKQFCHVNTREFKTHHLQTVLSHRLICLYFQFREQEINFENGLKKAIGFRIKNPKQYFNSLLGFSIQCKKVNESNHLCKLQNRNLFPEELAWLQEKFPNNPTIKFSNLIEALLDAIEIIPPIERNKLGDMLYNINSLEDCKPILKLLNRQSGRIKEDIQVDLQFYLEENHQEVELMRKDQTGDYIYQEILAYVNQ